MKRYMDSIAHIQQSGVTCPDQAFNIIKEDASPENEDFLFTGIKSEDAMFFATKFGGVFVYNKTNILVIQMFVDWKRPQVNAIFEECYSLLDETVPLSLHKWKVISMSNEKAD